MKSKRILVVIKYLANKTIRLFTLMKIILFNELNGPVICCFFFLFHQPTLIIVDSMKLFESEKEIITVNRKEKTKHFTENCVNHKLVEAKFLQQLVLLRFTQSFVN